ncbi:transcriptional repressor [Campylobacter sp. 9BO]|uniref:Fur family transcriptional regulator n=1 Tax=Campylobacter sp. 9BO TaxID=3424759 RepID=UPI003D348EEF
MSNFESFYKNFSSFLSQLNYKNSYIKERILSILYQSQSHLSAAQIQQIFSQKYGETISLTAIYGFLNFLDECHLTNTYEIDGVQKYELNLKSHHDHLICEKCHKVISFSDETIESRQDEICAKHGFVCKSHSMIIYGICAECSSIKNN